MPLPRIPAEQLIGLARPVSSGLARAGAPVLGARLLNVLAHRVPERRLKADLLAEAAELELSHGLTPAASGPPTRPNSRARTRCRSRGTKPPRPRRPPRR